jgi:hypothetical protein
MRSFLLMLGTLKTRGGTCIEFENDYYNRLERFYSRYPEYRLFPIRPHTGVDLEGILERIYSLSWAVGDAN